MSCEICKKHKGPNPDHYRESVIFDHNRAFAILLCNRHDNELFLQGQYRFLTKYKHVVGDRFQSPPKSGKKREYF